MFFHKYHVALVTTVNFKSRNSEFSHLFLCLIVLAILIPFLVHVNFRIKTEDSFLSFFYLQKDFLLGIHMPTAMIL